MLEVQRRICACEHIAYCNMGFVRGGRRSVGAAREAWLGRSLSLQGTGLSVNCKPLVVGNSTMDKMRKARSKAHLSQAQVAERMGTTQSVGSRIEGGGNVFVETLVRYATACGGKLKVQVVLQAVLF